MLNLLIQANMRHDLADMLQAIDQVSGFTFMPVQGYGSHAEGDFLRSSRDRVVGYAPRIKVEILLPDNEVQSVLDLLRDALAHERSHGLYWIIQVEESDRL